MQELRGLGNQIIVLGVVIGANSLVFLFFGLVWGRFESAIRYRCGNRRYWNTGHRSYRNSWHCN